MAQDLDFVRTEGSEGPRGDYYDYCSLLDNGTLAFGTVEGNYAGGATFAYNFYGDPRTAYPVGHIPTKEYWIGVKETLDDYKEHDADYYTKIIEMCKQHNVDILTIIKEKQWRYNKCSDLWKLITRRMMLTHKASSTQTQWMKQLYHSTEAWPMP